MIADPAAGAIFEAFNRTEQYSALHPILSAHTANLRRRRIDTLLARLRQRGDDAR